ncbi:MAG: hypothetical protein ACRCW2_07370 [Cellulosilyticaceae bacterium]
MRKAVMIGVMVLLVGAYIVILQKSPESKVEQTLTPTVTETLLETLPQTPEELIETHNQLMAETYNSQTTEEDVQTLVSTMRKLYSKEFLALNTEIAQQEALIQELAVNSVGRMYLISSKLEYIKYNDKEDQAEAVVTHQTTKGDQKRVYSMALEEGTWKILRWENITASQTPEE